MKRGKHICETLKGIRREIARANDIDYSPTECTHEGDCAGTCPHCENETRWLENQLRLRQSLGKAVTIAGLTLGAGAILSSCSCVPDVRGEMSPREIVNTPEPEVDGDVAPVPDSTLMCTDPDSSEVRSTPDSIPKRTAGMVRMEPSKKGTKNPKP